MADSRDDARLWKYRRGINVKNAKGETALCLAQSNDNRQAYEILLRFGASKNVDCHKSGYWVVHSKSLGNYAKVPVATATDAFSAGMAAAVIGGGDKQDVWIPDLSSLRQCSEFNAYDSCETGVEYLSLVDTLIGKYSGTTEFHNYQTFAINGKGDLNAPGGAVYLETGGAYQAEELEGDLIVGMSVVAEGQKNVYKEDNALMADNTDNLELISQSAMFDAQKDGNSAVLVRKDFAEFTLHKSIADYLNKNYEAGNLSSVYDKMKEATTAGMVSAESAKLTGQMPYRIWSMKICKQWRI